MLATCNAATAASLSFELATCESTAAAAMSSPQTLDLLGSGWKLESADGKHVVEDVSVPGQALQMLHDAGLVDDPLHGCGLAYA